MAGSSLDNGLAVRLPAAVVEGARPAGRRRKITIEVADPRHFRVGREAGFAWRPTERFL